MNIEFAPDDELLLVAARKRPGWQRRIRWAHIEIVEQPVGFLRNRLLIKQAQTRARRRWAIVRAEDCVVGEIEIEQQSAPMPIFGNVRDGEFFDLSRRKLLALAPIKLDAAARRVPQSRENFDQFSLAVAFDARDADDFARAHFKRNIGE